VNIPWQFLATGNEDNYTMAVKLYLQDFAKRVHDAGVDNPRDALAFIQQDIKELGL
jgi:hypothetical protein